MKEKCSHCVDGVKVVVVAESVCCGELNNDECCGYAILQPVQIQEQCKDCQGTGYKLTNNR